MTIAARVDGLDWLALQASLWERGYAQAPAFLDADECAALVASYETAAFRSRVDMGRHRFGEGEYKYLADPLPPLVGSLREHLYPPLARVANAWAEALGDVERFPPSQEELRARCRAAGQTRPTPLLLRYGPGGYNCLHQDLYGGVAFPLQAIFPLCRPGLDHTGGELVLVEQRPRAQSAAEVLSPGRGDLVVFTTRVRPARGRHGWHRVQMRHGVSRVRSGSRLALGVIFHDAR
ncbi:MAG: 2OG-Fe(II) oxygenase [Vicinamibacteria bacterium]